MATISAVPADFLSTVNVLHSAEPTELVGRAKAGDASACQNLFRAHGTRIYSLSLRLAGEPLQAERLTRDIFLATFANLHAIASDHAFAVELRRQSAKVASEGFFKTQRAASQAQPAS